MRISVVGLALMLIFYEIRQKSLNFTLVKEKGELLPYN